MFKRFFSVWLLFQVVVLPSYSQLSILQEALGDRQELVFDVSGKMISYPSTFITPKTRLIFKVRSSTNIYAPYIKMLKKHLRETKKYMQSEEAREAYKCFFAGEYEGYIAAIDKVDAIPDDICDSASLKSTLRSIAAAVDNYILIVKLVENIERQYFVKVYINKTCVDTIGLYAAGNCSPGCIDFDTVGYKRLKDMSCKSCVAQVPALIRFELMQDDPWNKTIREWFTTKAIAFNTANTDVKPFINALQSVADTAIGLAKYNGGLNDLARLKSWFLSWFWFNGGKLALDPFNILTDEGRKKTLSLVKEYEDKIKLKKEKINYLDSLLAAVARKGDADTDFETLFNDKAELMKNLERDIKEKEAVEKLLIPGKLLAQVSAYNVLYEGKMQQSKSFSIANKSINPHKQFDALMAYKPISLNPVARRKITEIPENEQMYIAVHNVPDTVRTMRFVETTLAFNDIEEFTKVLGEQLSQYKSIRESVTDTKNLEDFLRSVTIQGIGTKGLSNLHIGSSTCNEIQPFLENLYARYLDNQQTFPPDADLFKILNTTAPVNRTEISPVPNEDAPFRDSIVFRAVYKKDSAIVNRTFVKVGKLRLFQLAAGIAIARKPASVTNIDTTGNGFKVSSSDNRAAAIFAIKIYPFKNYNRDHGLIPRYPLRRLSVMGGFELLHPLDNFYLGGSYDLIPGLAFSMGTNWYQKTSYKVENNVVTNTSRSYERSGAYYSVTVNPVLFTQFVKLFFTSL